MEDENGNIVRETMKDTDTLARYKTMHETLVYLSHLDHDDTENQMLEKLRLQVHPLSTRAGMHASPRARPCAPAWPHLISLASPWMALPVRGYATYCG